MTVKEFWESERDLCIHCDTEEKANKLLKKFHELGERWCTEKSYLENNHYDVYRENTVYYNVETYGYLQNARKNGIKIIEFDDLEDFKENHEKDVFDYGFNHLITSLKEKINGNYNANFFGKCFFPIPKINSRFTINKEKKCVFLQLGSKKINVKCADEDKFDWKIGLGLAISQLRDNGKFKAHREFFRNNKTHKLDIEKYTNWILNEFYHNDMIDLHNLELRVKNAKDKEFIDL